jgi:predicted GNAT superfamily acetyltransferase
MTREVLDRLDELAEDVGQAHSRAEELEGLDAATAAAVARASELLDQASELITRAYVAAAPAVGASSGFPKMRGGNLNE